MKTLHSLIAILFLAAVCPLALSQTTKRQYIRYTEKVCPNGSHFRNQGIPKKPQRVSNNAGTIVFCYDDVLPDSIQIALNAAKKMWESKLPIKVPIYISVSFESLGNEISMIADVSHSGDDNVQGYPSTLASQITGDSSSPESPDGLIYFNSDINWNCNFSDESVSEYNLPTMALRGIARCLGFGSSVILDEEEFAYSFEYRTNFDKLLFCNGKNLSSIAEGSQEMANFATSDNVYAVTKSQRYKVFAPSEFIPDVSLCYLEDDNTLMSHDLGQGNISLSIDDTTSDILRAVGWDLPLSGLKINCNDITDNGIGSSYSSHTFTLAKESENISGYKWRFLLKNKNEDYVQISTGTNDFFTISKVSSPSNYYVNVNGDLEGRIECDYKINGKYYNAVPFALSLELKPVINSIDNITVINSGPNVFSLMFNVNYTGADEVSVEVEEEYNTTLRDYCFYEPYIAHVKTGDITSLYYSWVTIIVSNKYGSAYETLEYSPILKTLSEPKIIMDAVAVNYIRLYSADGRMVFEGSPREFMNCGLETGVYIKNEIFDNGKSRISKVYIK